MDRHIGIVIGRDGAAAGVTLVRQGTVVTVESALLHAAGRIFTPGELAKVLKTEQSDRIIVGAYFEHVAMLDLSIPLELSPEESLGVAQFQLAGQIPVPITEMVCHMRRIEVGDGSRVRIAAITVDNWMQPLSLLSAAGVEVDMVTTPLLAGDCGVAGDLWIVPEFEPEFAFGPTGIELAGGQKPEWTPEMNALIEEANLKKTGMGRERLLPAAIQMALLSLKNPPLLFPSVNTMMPKELKPKRHTMLKRVLMLLVFISVGLGVAFGGRWYKSNRENNRKITAFNTAADAEIQRLTSEVRHIDHAIKLADEGFRALGKPNYIFRLISRLTTALPKECYVKTIKTAANNTIQLVISSENSDDGPEIRRGLDSLDPKYFKVIDMPNETDKSGNTVHTATISLLGD